MAQSSGGHRSDAPLLGQYACSQRAGDLLFLAGVSSRQPDNTIRGASRSPSGALEIDIRAQTVACIENLRSALEAEGLQLNHLVDVTVFLVNMADYGGFNEAWNQFFDTSGPTRTTVAVHQLPDPRLAIELKAIATFTPSARPVGPH
jgi:2-aminomuconate deaminase